LAADAVRIDTTGMPIDQVVDKVMGLIANHKSQNHKMI
jgi:cytidylate kinase